MSGKTYCGLFLSLIVLVFLLNENDRLQNNITMSRDKGFKFLNTGLKKSLVSLNEIAVAETKLSEAPTPFFDFLFGIGRKSVDRCANVLTSSFISAALQSSGFFPSNLMDTFDALFEYSFRNTMYALDQMFTGLSNVYWHEYSTVGLWGYLEAGNRFAVMSEVCAQFSLIEPLTGSMDMAPQDSWLGNVIVSIPNITFQTTANITTWKNGFTHLSKITQEMSLLKWRGTYDGYSGKEKHWYCYGCAQFFSNVATQANIVAMAPDYRTTSTVTDEEEIAEEPSVGEKESHPQTQEEEFLSLFTRSLDIEFSMDVEGVETE